MIPFIYGLGVGLVFTISTAASFFYSEEVINRFANIIKKIRK